MLKGVVLWALGVPIFVIILLYMFVFWRVLRRGPAAAAGRFLTDS